MAWNWDYVARGLAGLLALLGWSVYAPSHMARAAWTSANREMRYLEAMARRLLIARAETLVLPPVRPRTRTPAPATPAATVATDDAPCPARPRGFRFIEPTMEAHFRGWFDGDDPPPPAAPRAPYGPGAPVVPAHALAARISALKSTLEAPETATRRMARHLARKTRILCLARRRPLAPGGAYDLRRDAFFESERLALAVFNRPFFGTGPPVDPERPSYFAA
ncbi:MAG: hypothetical protein AAF965_09375 [Pseudomonadota bacterium]